MSKMIEVKAEDWKLLLEQLWTAKGLLAAAVVAFGGKMILPSWVLDKVPLEGELKSELTDEGLTLYYEDVKAKED